MSSINGRKLVECLEPIRGVSRVRVRCETCGEVTAITRKSWRQNGCGNCTVSRDSVNARRQRERYDDLMREAGEECREIWREHSEKDREVHCLAVTELVTLTGPLTTSEIGELWGVSRQRVQQIERIAMKKFRLRIGAVGREYAEHERDDWTLWDEMGVTG